MNNVHTDVFGNVLEIGDMVATTHWGNGKTRFDLVIAEVVGFTEQKIRIKYIGIKEFNTKTKQNENKTTTKYSNQLSKRCEVNIFKDSQDYLYNNLGMTEEDAKATAK